jgi:hypothetical protein
MGTGRWRITLVEETEVLPIRRRHPAEPGIAALVAAAEHLGRRSDGPEGWSAAPGSDPIAFLLDTMADAVNVWAGPSIVYRNRAAERLEASARPLVRRTLRFPHDGTDYLLEIITEESHATR